MNGGSEAEEADCPKGNCDDGEWEAELGLVDALVLLRELKADQSLSGPDIDLVLFHRMPPGPHPLPFIDNKFDIPKSHQSIQFQKWSEIHGPIFILWLGRRPTVVISDSEAAVDLLEKRSNKYSSRPRFVTISRIY